jgi:Tfp pilus assembly protein PilF
MLLELAMRLTPPAIGIALALATVSSVGHSQRPDAAIDARSMLLLAQAKAELAAGHPDAANDALESALAVDPRNRGAFAMMAEVAQKQGLPGKAIRLYRESLLIEPNDIAVLAGQGEAMVAKGAVTKAKENLARIKTLCVGTCPDGMRLAATIEKGPPPVVQSAQAAPVLPVGTPR